MDTFNNIKVIRINKFVFVVFFVGVGSTINTRVVASEVWERQFWNDVFALLFCNAFDFNNLFLPFGNNDLPTDLNWRCDLLGASFTGAGV